MSSPFSILASGFRSLLSKCKALLRLIGPLIGLIILLAWILQHYELPAEHLRVDAQATIHDQIGDALFIDVLPFTVTMSSIADKSQCLWTYDNFVNSSRFCDWYYEKDEFKPHMDPCDHHNLFAPFAELLVLRKYSKLFAVDYLEHYSTQSCTSCFPPEKVGVIEGLPRLAAGADNNAYGLYWNSFQHFQMNKYNFAKVCDESITSIALNGWCIPSVCPLQTPEVEEVEACRLTDRDPTVDKETKFNNTCLTNKDDCPNCDRLRYKATEPSLGVKIEFAEIFSNFRRIYDSSSPPEYFNWDWPGSIFFATTIVTTIGYGSFSPTTDEGKAWLVVLSIPLIGVFGFCLSEAMGVVVEGISTAGAWVRDVMLCKKRIRLHMTIAALAAILRKADADKNNLFSTAEMVQAVVEMEDELGFDHKAVHSRTDEQRAQAVADEVEHCYSKVLPKNNKSFRGPHNLKREIDHLAALTILSQVTKKRMVLNLHEHSKGQLNLVIVLFFASIFMGMLVFGQLGIVSGGSIIDNPSYLDSLYFCLITSTTIGLGDFAPNFQNSGSAIVWLLYVMFTLSLSGTIIQNVGSLQMPTACKSLGKKRDGEGTQEDGSNDDEDETSLPLPDGKAPLKLRSITAAFTLNSASTGDDTNLRLDANEGRYKCYDNIKYDPSDESVVSRAAREDLDVSPVQLELLESNLERT